MNPIFKCRKYLYAICMCILSISMSIGQTGPKSNKKYFDKVGAQTWLNNKCSKYFSNDSYQKMIRTKVNFSNCNLTSYSVLEIKNLKNTINSYSVNLNRLNPESLKIQYDSQDSEKFYIWVTTTNSENVIAYYSYSEGDKPEILNYENRVQVGPFDKNEANIEDRVKTTLKNLILECGGKKDSF